METNTVDASVAMERDCFAAQRAEWQTNMAARKAAAQRKADDLAVAKDALEEGSIARGMELALQHVTLREALKLADKARGIATEYVPLVGDVLVSSWGYDQTNVDYYVVTRVTAKCVVLAECGKRVVSSDDRGTCDCVMPDPTRILATHKTDRDLKGPKRFRATTDGYSCNIGDWKSASLWDGMADHQTGSSYGH